MVQCHGSEELDLFRDDAGHPAFGYGPFPRFAMDHDALNGFVAEFAKMN